MDKTNTIPYKQIAKVGDLKNWASEQKIPIFKSNGNDIAEYSNCLIKKNTVYGLTYQKIQEGKVIEEINFEKGKNAYRYISPEGEVKKATFDFSGTLEEPDNFVARLKKALKPKVFPYSFQDSNTPVKEKILINKGKGVYEGREFVVRGDTLFYGIPHEGYIPCDTNSICNKLMRELKK